MAAARIRIVARVGRRSALPRYLLGSVLAHGLFVAALVLFPALRPKKTVVPDALVVSLVAAPRPSVATPAPPAPAPPREAPRETARLETREPPPVKPLPENPKPKKKPPPKAAAQAPKAAPTPVPPKGADSGGTPGASAAGPSGPSGATVAMEGGVDSAFGWYRDSVVSAILTQWRRPVLDGLTSPIDVLIAVEILPDGSVRNLRVDRSSGVPALDRSALRAVADAVPLPSLPMHWPGPTWNVAIIFRQHPE